MKVLIFSLVALLLLLPLESFAMKTPLLTLNPLSSAPSNSAVRYISVGPAGGNAAGTSNNSVVQVMPISGSFSRLYGVFPDALSGGQSYTVELLVNGVATELGFTITSASTYGSDTVDVIPVNEGDQVSIRITPTGTPTSQATGIQMSILFEASVRGESLILNSMSSASTTGTCYSPFGFSDSCDGTEANASTLMPTSGTIDKFNLLLSAAPGTGVTRTMTLVKNGTPTALTCSVANSNTSCSDTSNSVTASPGDRFSIQSTYSGGTPAAGNAKMSYRFVPTIPGESVMIAAGGNMSSTLIRYIGTSKYDSTTATEASTMSIAPIDFEWKKLYVDVNTAPGTGNSRSIASRINQATSTLTATISESNTSSLDIARVVTVKTGDTVNWVSEPFSTPTSPGGRTRVSAVMYIPPPNTFLQFGTMIMNFGRFIIN